MSRRFAFLTVLLVASVPLGAGAQTAAPQGHFPTAQATIVTFSVTGHVRSTSGETFGLPAALLERLSQQRALAQLDVGGGNTQDLVVRFVFGSMDAFQAWHASAETRRLMEDIKAQVIGPTLNTSLAVKRPPLSNLAGR